MRLTAGDLRRTAESKDITLPLDVRGELKGDGGGGGGIPLSVARVGKGLIPDLMDPSELSVARVARRLILDLMDPSGPGGLILTLVSSLGMDLGGSTMVDKRVDDGGQAA
jgi:hypothetical protein